jgi:hypothetical protein
MPAATAGSRTDRALKNLAPGEVSIDGREPGGKGAHKAPVTDFFFFFLVFSKNERPFEKQ